jgi:hypothetical protein
MPDPTIVPRKAPKAIARPWFVYVNGRILCTKRGSIRKFSTRKAALKAAKAASTRLALKH